MISRSLGHALPDLVNVWRDTRQIVLVAQTAAVYAAILIPFKMGIPLIPGFAELRPANAFPIVASLLFGPVAAWGSGFGNLIGDCFGTLGPGSLFGFIGNFCYGYVPYLLWGRLGPLSSGPDPELHSWRQVLEFAVVSAAASVVCAVTIAWGVELLGLLPFTILAPAIFLNNLVMAWLLAPPLLVFLLPRVTRWGLRYEDLRATPAATQARTTDAQISPPAASEDTAIGSAFVQAQAVRFTYKGASRPALNDVSFSLARGHSLAVMGRSGAGKSTLCLALSGLVPQMIPGDWGGRLTIHQRETTTYPVWDLADTVGIVFQDFEAQLVSTNLEMELAFPLGNVNRRTHAYAPQEMRAKVVQMLGTVGLAGLERYNPLTLSGGQRQRLVLGSILIREPGLLVLDEPMTDLDT
ncbi:MAG: ATP-binding cassette domain-containing protein, partial [Nitrospirales bacterium]